jgi:hypothetical protein
LTSSMDIRLVVRWILLCSTWSRTALSFIAQAAETVRVAIDACV